MKRMFSFVLAFGLAQLMGLQPAAALDIGGAQREINDIRNQLSLPNMRINSTLTKAAKKQATYLAAKGLLSHSAGGTLRSRIRASGFNGDAGENLGRGQSSMSKVIIGWMNSPSHRANMLDPDFNCFGLGSAPDKNGKPYWVLFLGSC